jgi:hypothetical protein
MDGKKWALSKAYKMAILILNIWGKYNNSLTLVNVKITHLYLYLTVIY